MSSGATLMMERGMLRGFLLLPLLAGGAAYERPGDEYSNAYYAEDWKKGR